MTSKNISKKYGQMFLKKQSKVDACFKIDSCFPHGFPTSNQKLFRKKNMQNNIDFPKKFPNLFKGVSNESMTPVWSRRNLPSAGIWPHRIGRGHALCAAHQGLGPRYMMMGLYS